jgi:hypothetical protein
MAAVGDVLVKFVADFADFSSNMTKSQKQIEDWAQSIKGATQSVEGFVQLAQKAFVALGIAEAIKQVMQYADTVAAAGVNINDMAKKLGVTTDQFQALEAMSRRSGVSVEDLSKAYKGNSDAMNALVEDAKRAGLVMDEGVTKKFKEMAVASDDASKRMQVFFAPAVAGVKSFIADSLERIANDIQVVAAQQGVLDKIETILRMLGYGGGAGQGQQFKIDTLQRNVDRAEQLLKDEQQRATPVGPYGVPASMQQRVTDAEKKLEDARIALGQAKDAANRAQYGPSPLQQPPITVTATATGGKPADDDDTIERQIKRYTALLAAADKAAKTIHDGQGQFIDDLTRQVRVQEQVDDIVAKIVAKGHGIPDPKDVARLTEVVTLEQKRRDENAKQLQYLATADQLEQRLGDGSRARAIARRDQQRIADTGLASPEAQARNAKQTAENLDAQARAASRYDDSLESLANGFLNASAAQARAHDLFSVGGQAFDALTSAMGEGIDALVGKSNKGFGQIAADFLLMIAKMTAAAAISQVFQYLLKAAGFAAGAATATPSSGVQFADVGDLINHLPQRAAGGPVYPGTAYVVGERGPETFVPTAAGNIVPAGQMGGSSGGVTVNIDMNQTAGAPNPTAALDFGRKVKAAVVAVIANEKRPGGSLHPATA